MINTDTSDLPEAQVKRLFLTIQGIVQGVGFRPFVYKLAQKLNLKGYVKNTSDGVIIDIEGTEVNEFITLLKRDYPPLSIISHIDCRIVPLQGYTDFSINESNNSGTFTLISPDVGMCEKCRHEITTLGNRRYLYPFTNCTNCGPRYSITTSVPYDRAQTTMTSFIMCKNCQTEYDNPSDRRFHAQPNACHVCGPQVELVIKNESTRPACKGIEAIRRTINLLKQGALVAIKGLGGFHISCNGLNKGAVETLRQRKRKSNKPFALMARDMTIIRKYAHVSQVEERLLSSHQSPILLLKKKKNTQLPESLSPHNNFLGFMLPYTPLHYLLFFSDCAFHDLKEVCSLEVLVMTSGNISEEPIEKDNHEALMRLCPLVDAFLIHNRDIFMRIDDSVLRVLNDKSLFVRRARGYVPEPIMLHERGPEVLAIGADLKNTLTLTKGEYAIVSQHIGDRENYETEIFFEKVYNHLKNLYRVNPVAVAFDMHPGYVSTKWAKKLGIKHIPVQHHHAHIASVMAEHRIIHKIIGVAFDGTGYGLDGRIWGGEFLIVDPKSFERFCHFDYIPLIGGEMALKQPFRAALAWMVHAFGHEVETYCRLTGFMDIYGSRMIKNCIKLSHNPSFSPPCSSAGRLFDALSALLGICPTVKFEAEAAMALEAEVCEGVNTSYEFSLTHSKPLVVDFKRTLSGIISDMVNGVLKGIIAAKFHNTIVRVICTVVEQARKERGLTDVALSGGVFQNIYLLKRTLQELRAYGFNVFYNTKVPANDGGISLGQSYSAREILKEDI
jgi:hydrogenase maturation protein HypF